MRKLAEEVDAALPLGFRAAHRQLRQRNVEVPHSSRVRWRRGRRAVLAEGRRGRLESMVNPVILQGTLHLQDRHAPTNMVLPKHENAPDII